MLPKDDYHQEKQVSPSEILEKKRNIEYRKLFSTQTGNWVLMDMCKRVGLLVAISEQNLDPQVLAYDAGKQFLVIDILHRLKMNPIQLRQEQVVSDG